MSNIAELLKNEIKFCEEFECIKNEHGAYIYNSKNRNHSFNLPAFLSDYKDWLIENNIVKEIKKHD